MLKMGHMNITDEDMMWRIHNGLFNEPELKTAMATLKRTTLSEYRNHMMEIQGDMKAVYNTRFTR